MGQNVMSALADNPGINLKSVAAFTNQNGTVRVNTSAKIFRGDLFLKARRLVAASTWA